MILDEGTEMLEDAYYLQNMETTTPLSKQNLTEVVVTYMLIYAFQAERRNRTDLPRTISYVKQSYPRGWPAGTYGHAQMQAVLHELRAENPFAVDQKSKHSFDV